MRQFAGPDLLAFLLIRHTGLRGFDATDLPWANLALNDRMFSRLTHKRKKQVWIPLHPELHCALEAECVRPAEVARGHPHRFRDALAVGLLLKGATAYDVEKTLGDTVAVVEEHYAP